MNEQIGADVDHKGETATPTAPVSQQVLDKYQADKRALLDLDDQCGYACDELSYKEKIAESKLDKLRQQMFEEDLLLVNRPYYENYKKILNSPLYSAFLELPKPGIHHTHLTACADLDFLLKLTYYEYVFYSEKDDKFIVNKKLRDNEKPGYLKVNTWRQNAANADEFDRKLKENILLRVAEPEDHVIWAQF